MWERRNEHQIIDQPIMLKLLLFIVLSIIGVYFVRRKDRERADRAIKSRDDFATSDQIPGMVDLLARARAGKSFIVIMFVPPGATEDDAINFQYSFEGGSVGMDWLLISQRNIADEAAIAAFVKERGYSFNYGNPRFPRVEGEGIGELGRAIVDEFYRLPAGTRLDLVVEGVAWNPMAGGAV
ncbi:MAG: hypothetical protein JWQ98_939 [Chlorobi bacterium]|nr:hypothetical protein [Chlorobiota bacterium]